MTAFRAYLVVILLALGAYTVVVGSTHGWNLLPIFFGDMAALTWPGQFNADFMSFLLLSGIWVAWRNRFSPAGVGLGMVAVFGGMLFLAPYLLLLTFRANGDMATVLLGESRRDEPAH